MVDCFSPFYSVLFCHLAMGSYPRVLITEYLRGEDADYAGDEVVSRARSVISDLRLLGGIITGAIAVVLGLLVLVLIAVAAWLDANAVKSETAAKGPP